MPSGSAAQTLPTTASDGTPRFCSASGNVDMLSYGEVAHDLYGSQLIFPPNQALGISPDVSLHEADVPAGQAVADSLPSEDPIEQPSPTPRVATGVAEDEDKRREAVGRGMQLTQQFVPHDHKQQQSGLLIDATSDSDMTTTEVEEPSPRIAAAPADLASVGTSVTQRGDKKRRRTAFVVAP